MTRYCEDCDAKTLRDMKGRCTLCEAIKIQERMKWEEEKYEPKS